jgi:hypothetical protein
MFARIAWAVIADISGLLNLRKTQLFGHTKIIDFQGIIQNIGRMESRKSITGKNPTFSDNVTSLFQKGLHSKPHSR